MTRSRVFKLVGLVIIVLLAVVIYRLAGTLIEAKGSGSSRCAKKQRLQ
jgi:hypothetical protein